MTLTQYEPTTLKLKTVEGYHAYIEVDSVSVPGDVIHGTFVIARFKGMVYTCAFFTFYDDLIWSSVGTIDHISQNASAFFEHPIQFVFDN
jgi:hypothetical protein